MIEFENVDAMVAAVAYRFRLATLCELQTVYGLKDLFTLWEIGYVYEENENRLYMERAVRNGGKKRA